MRAFLLLLALFMVLSCRAEGSAELFTVYLVRHAEKQNDSQDPALTTCGVQRANALARLLSAVNLQRVYSSDFQRTRDTASTVALQKNLPLELYDPGKLEWIKATLLARRQDALVVGHSDTTAVLAGLLAGRELGDIEYHTYDRIYQVVVAAGRARVHLLHDTFVCRD